jgi:hypothetical protein
MKVCIVGPGQVGATAAAHKQGVGSSRKVL